MGRPSISVERRKTILDAFERCVLRLGLTETSLDDVAEETGLPRSVVRYFVGNRDDMVALLIDRMIERVELSVVERFAERAEPSADTLVTLLFDDVMGDLQINQIVAELWHVSLRNAAVGKRLHDIYNRLVDELAEKIAKLGGARRKAQCRMTAYTVVALALGTTNLSAFGVLPKGVAEARKAALVLLEAS